MPVQPQQINIQITLAIAECNCDSFTLSEFARNNNVAIAVDRFEFTFGVNFSLLEATRQAKVVLVTKLFEKQPGNVKMELAELHSSMLFFLQNFEELIQRDATTGNALIPSTLIELCNGTAVSTARGIYCIKLKDTIYSNAILPLIDTKMLAPRPGVPLA